MGRSVILADQVVRFTVAPPASKKNRKRWIKRGGRRFLVPSEDAVASEEEIALKAQAALARIGGTPWGPDAALSIDLYHDLEFDQVHVEVRQVGTIPKKHRGTRRDCHGMIETVADALQEVLYPDDRQVDAGSWRRLRHVEGA